MQNSSVAALFAAENRLFVLEGEGALAALEVEGWTGREALSEIAEWRILALSDSGTLDLDDMISRPVTLWTTCADGSRVGRSGLVRAAELLSGDAGLARYRLTVVPWLWLATQQRASRMFEDRSTLDILAQVLSAYEGYTYELADDVSAALAGQPTRRYVTQYRETDYAFLSRLLAEAGLAWTWGEDAEAPARHSVRIFADSRGLPEDAQSEGVGVPFQRAGAAEARDGVQALTRRLRRSPDRVTLLGWHDGGKRAITADALTRPSAGESGTVDAVEWFDATGHGSLLSEEHARRQAELVVQSLHAQAEVFVGQGTVRTFRSGTRFLLENMASLGPREEKDFEPRFALDAVEHVGINNLPDQARASLDERLGSLEDGLCFEQAPAAPGVRARAGESDRADSSDALPDDEVGTLQRCTPAGKLLVQARATGYANRFDAVRCDRPWRAPIPSGRGARLSGATTAHGVQTAIVVGADGSSEPQGGDEILRNPRGDVRVRFHWQAQPGASEAHSRWVRVAQRQAGAGMGMTFVPRIGQEVLVRFLDEDIDQPVVIGALYNGRGEGGVVPTPAGAAAQGNDPAVFAAARDNQPSAQANLAAGHSPAWHGAAASDAFHRNAAALSGFKSKEFGATGYNQVVFDDSDQQLRLHIGSTQAASALTLGHLIHQPGNYRGSLRGVGAELRTDGHGALRGGAGVLLSTYAATSGAASGEAAGLQALASQADQMAQSLDGIVGAHQGVRLAAAIGAPRAGASVLDPDYAPLAAMHRTVSGTVSGDSLQAAQDDASSKHTQAGEGKVPHTTDPVVLMAARAGLAQVAGQHVQYTAGEAVHWSAGKDQNHAVAGALHIYTGQAAGLVAGVQKGAEGAGLDLLSARGDVSLQAQHDVLQAQAQLALGMTSTEAGITYAAPKRVRIATAAGASIVLEGGNITVTAPGRIDVQMGDKRLEGPASMPYTFPVMPQQICVECLKNAMMQGLPIVMKT